MTTASVGRGLVARMFAPRAATLRNPVEDWITDWFGGSKSLSGEVVNSKTALGIGAYFACLRAISEDIGKLPRFTYKRLKPRGRERAPEHTTYRLVHSEPNPEMSAMAFHETLTSHALGWKGGFAEIVRDGGGNPRELWPLDPSHVQQVREKNTRKLAYEVRHPDMQPVYLPPENILHLHGLGYDGITGYILSCIAKEALGGAIAVAKHGAAFFGNGATQSGVLKIPGTLSKPALDNLRNSWADRYAGTENSHKPVILEQGLEWESTSTDPQKSQMIESMEFSVEDVARWFRVPPNKIGHFKRAQGWSTVEMLNIDYVVDTLTPWLARWEQEYNRKLLKPSERDTYYIEHEVKGLMRGDAQARVAFYRGMFDMGAMSPNDIREDENLNPVENGDKYLVQLNLTTLEKAGEQPEPDPAGKPTTDPDPKPAKKPEDRLQTMIAMASAHESLLADALARVLRVEATKSEQAIKTGDFAKLERTFYANHADHVIAAIGGVYEACFAALLGHIPDSAHSLAVFGLVKEYALEHCIESLDGMRDIDCMLSWSDGTRAASAAKKQMAKLVDMAFKIGGTA